VLAVPPKGSKARFEGSERRLRDFGIATGLSRIGNNLRVDGRCSVGIR